MILLWTALALASTLTAEGEVIYAPTGAVGTPVPFEVQFTAEGDVSVGDISILNERGTSFTIDGAPTLDLSSGVGTLKLLFTPSGPGGHSGTLEVQSDADCAAPATIELRGTGIEPCIEVSPTVMDFGPMIPPDADRILLRLRSCDGQSWVAQNALTDNSRFAFGTTTPLAISPTVSNVTVQYQPVDESPQSGVLTIGDWGTEVQMYANDCLNGDPDRYDSDGDGTSDCGVAVGGFWADEDGDGFTGADGDCDDGNAAINPVAEEVDGGVDDNCNGRTDEHLDFDGDGNRLPDDCDDADAWVNIGEVEVLDGVDNNCNGEVDEGLEPVVCEEVAADEKGCGCSQSGPVGPWGLILAGLALARRRVYKSASLRVAPRGTLRQPSRSDDASRPRAHYRPAARRRL